MTFKFFRVYNHPKSLQVWQFHLPDGSVRKELLPETVSSSDEKLFHGDMKYDFNSKLPVKEIVRSDNTITRSKAPRKAQHAWFHILINSKST